MKDKPAGHPVALVHASLGVGSYAVQLACISAPAGYTPAAYAQLLSALAAHDGMFRAALWATSTIQGPASIERSLTLEAAAPPGWEAACGSLLTTRIQLHYTMHNPSLCSSTAVPTVCLEHLPPIGMGRASFESSHNPAGDPSPLHTTSPKASSFGKVFGSPRYTPSHVGSGISQAGSRASSMTAGARSSNPTPEVLQQLQIRRSQLMHGELPVLLTLFTQDGFVLEQNFNSALYYGQIKGKRMWKGNLSRKIELAELEEAEPEPDVGPLEQLFRLAPVELKMLLEHLVDPSQGPWKGTIQVTPTGFTSESTFRESPGRLSLGPYQGLETASAVRPGAAGELPPAAVPMNGPSPFAGMQGRMSHPGYQDTLLDSYPYAMVSLTATHPIQTSTVSLNGVGTARYAELPPSAGGMNRHSSTATSMGGVGGVTSRNAQSSRLASQLAVKKKCHTFHEKSHLLPAQSAPLEPQPQDLLRYPSEVPNMQQSSSIPKGPSPNGSLIAPLDVALGKDSQFLLNNRRDSQSSSVGSPDCNKPISRSRLEQPSAAPSGKQPLGGSRGGQFDLVEWGRQAEQGMLSKWEQQQQACKPRSRDSSVSTPSINLVEHAAHRRTSNTAQSSLLTDTARASRQDKDKGGAGDAGGGGVSVAAGDKAVRVRGVRRSSSCSDLENVSAATSRNDRGQVRDKVQGFDSGQLGQPPSGWCGNSGGPHGYNHIYNHVWQAQTIEEEALQDLEGSAGPVGQDAQKTSTDGRDTKDRQVAKPESSLYHEVEVKLVPDPVTNRPAFLLIQRDVSEQVELENLLAELIEDQLAMLSQIFPRHVIQALTTQGAVTLDNIADLTFSHTNVTILFLDIVSFTSTCGKETVTPESVITFLNVLFSSFDKLVKKYQVQKIDTIGDAYLVASGILSPDGEGFWAVDQDHNAAQGAGRMMSLAVDMMRAALEVQMPDNQPVNLRIGLHTGPCVSGLVGLEVPKWSVFGDTVNTSARMEQTAVPGTIQISNATKRLLPDLDIGLKHNGAVAMKGKGTMETWLWFQPPEWRTAREAGIQPPLPKAIELLNRQCGIDTSEADAHEEELPTVRLPAAFSPSTQLPSKRLPDPSSSRAKINGFGGFDASVHGKSTGEDSKAPEVALRTSFSQEPPSRDTPTLVRRSSLPSNPSNPGINGIMLDDSKALEKALGSGSSQTPSWNQAPSWSQIPPVPQAAASAQNKKRDPAISRALHRLTDASITLPLAMTEAMKGLQGQGSPSSPCAASTPTRVSPPSLATVPPKPSGEGPSFVLLTVPPPNPQPLPASPFAAAAAAGCSSQGSQGAYKSALRECGSQRKLVDKLSWAPEPHTVAKGRQRSRASEEEAMEVRESSDRFNTCGPKVFELLRVASNSPLSSVSNSQVDIASWHQLNISSVGARRTARNSRATNIIQRTSSSRFSMASITSNGGDLMALSVRSSLPMLATTCSLPLPSWPSISQLQLESPSPARAGARGGGARLSHLKCCHKGQVRVLQRCHSEPLPTSATLSCASTSTRESYPGLKGSTSMARVRHRVNGGASRVHQSVPAPPSGCASRPGRHRPQGVLRLPTESVQALRKAARQRTAAVAAVAASSPVNIVQQIQQQGVVGSPSSTLKTGSCSTGGPGMAKEEGSFSMPLKYKVAAMLEEEEEAGNYAYGDESCGKSHAAHLAAKLATLPDKSNIGGSLTRTSSRRSAWSRKIAHVSASCNIVPSGGLNSQANAIPSGSTFRSLARVHGMSSQANALQPCGNMPRALTRTNTLGMSSQANAIFPAAGNSVYKALAKAHAHIGSASDQRQPTSPELVSGTGFATRPNMAKQNSGRRSSMFGGTKPQSLQP